MEEAASQQNYIHFCNLENLTERKLSLGTSPGVQWVKNLPAKGGSMGSIPDLGRFHMTWSNHACVPQLLSPNSRVQELQLLKPTCIKPMLCDKKATTVRRLRITVKSSPRSPPLEKDLTKLRRTSTVINN